VSSARKFLKFRCTGCGNCCKDPFLPLTDDDLRRIVQKTGERAEDIVRFVSRHEIDMDDEPEAFVRLRQGKRVMILGHARGACRYLDADDRCTIYGFRPIGCRVFPFDPTFSRTGALTRLRIIQATECRYELDGFNRVGPLRDLHERHTATMASYHQRVATWNRLQSIRLRGGLSARTAREFLEFLGLGTTGSSDTKRRSGEHGARSRTTGATSQSSRRYQLLQP
jgi:Fe-S-cluster containining protein